MAHLIGSENPSDTLVQPIWLYRVLPSLAVVALILAQTVAAKNPAWHDTLVGFATGLLIILCVVGFSAKAIILKDTEQPSDVHRYPLT
jgi:uncharacterized BrkB/YihY/UPF0761 family membrane protein